MKKSWSHDTRFEVRVSLEALKGECTVLKLVSAYESIRP